MRPTTGWTTVRPVRVRRNDRAWIFAHVLKAGRKTLCGAEIATRLTSPAQEGQPRCARCEALLALPTRCAVAGCANGGPFTRGWCKAHYTRWYRTGDVGDAGVTKRRPESPCKESGCETPVRRGGRGWCRKHYTAAKWRGDFTPTPTPTPAGAQHVQWTGDDATYSAVHFRLRQARGPATGWTCAHCGKSAREWAYAYSDPEPRWSPKGSPYSTDLDHYLPLCVPCHKRFDAEKRTAP